MADRSAAVRYFTKSGNTKKVADAIAKAVGIDAKQIPSPIEGHVDVLFLGASVYWGGVSQEVKDYVKALDKNQIGRVAVFSTSALAERSYPQIKKLLNERGIAVELENFYCRGQFAALHRGRPNQDDLKSAEKFASKMVERK